MYTSLRFKFVLVHRTHVYILGFSLGFFGEGMAGVMTVAEGAQYRTKIAI